MKTKSILTKIILLLLLFFSVNIFSQVISKKYVRFHVAESFFKKGTVYFNNMNYLAAVEFFRRAISKYPEYFRAREYLARAYYFAGFKEEAIKEYKLLKQLNPENISVRNKLNYLLFSGLNFKKNALSSKFVLLKRYRSSSFKGFSFSAPTSITIDNKKNLYIVSFASGKLTKIDSNGIGIFSKSYSFSSKLYGVDFFRGRLIVSDFKNDCLYLLTANGKLLKTIGTTGNAKGSFHGPEGVAFDENGNIYAVDSGNGRVQKFSSKGNFLQTIGSLGDYDGNFLKPTNVFCRKKKIFVSDIEKKQIVVFDIYGNFIKNISDDKIIAPRGILYFKKHLLIADTKNGLLSYDLNLNSTSVFLGKRTIGNTFDIALDRDNFLYSADERASEIKIFSPERKLYSNLNVDILSVDTSKFPTVAFYVNIRNRNGSPLYGLDRSNFQFIEDNAPITKIYTRYLKKKRPSVSFLLLVDRSMGNKKYRNDLSWAADFVLKKMRKNDSVKVGNFNSDYWASNKFDWSRRRTLRYLRKGRYGKGKNFGKAIYNSLLELLPRLNKRALLLITNGKLSENSFSQYSVENIIEFAKNHFIPINIISFKKPSYDLKRIARATGGAVYSPSNLGRLRKLYKKSKYSQEYRYVLIYKTFKPARLKGFWSNVMLKVNYNGQVGSEWGGYFVP